MAFHRLVIVLFLLVSPSCGQESDLNNKVDFSFDIGVDLKVLPRDVSEDLKRDTRVYTDMTRNDLGFPKLAKWDACHPEAYNETLVNLDVSIDDLIAGYDQGNYQTFVIDSLKRRAPFGAWIVEEVKRSQDFDCVKEYAEQYAGMGALEMLDHATTVVHECAHALNMATWNGTTHDYFVRPDEVYQVPIITGPERRVIKDYLLWEDTYSDVYLDLSGEQQFDMILEEVNGYINGLIVGVAFVDLAYEGKKVSIRDGSATLLLYMAIYLHHTRLNDNPVYQSIVNEEALRLAILTLWDRGKLALEIAAPYPEIGIEDAKILVELAKFSDEIKKVRTLHCGL